MKEFKLSNNKIFKIVQDDDTESPRTAWDNLGTIYHWHKRSNLGDIDLSGKGDIDISDYVGPNDLYLPIYCYDHGSITLNTTPFSCPFDSGQVGFIAISQAKIIEEYGQDYDIEKVRKYLVNEIKTFNQYINGDIYGYQLIQINTCETCGHGDDEEIESCYGFYGTDFKNNGILENLDDEIKEEVLKQIA